MRYYNQRVKLKRFNPKDMVLRKVSQATKDPNEGKLGPNWEGPYKEGKLLLGRHKEQAFTSSMECRTT